MVANIESENDIVNLKLASKKKYFIYDNDKYVYCECPKCSKKNVFPYAPGYNSCNNCHSPIYIEEDLDDIKEATTEKRI